MKTALIISELLELHDDTLIADIDRAFDEIDRTVEVTPPEDELDFELLLIVDELVDELLSLDLSEELSISLDMDVGMDEAAQRSDEVAEVA